MEHNEAKETALINKQDCPYVHHICHQWPIVHQKVEKLPVNILTPIPSLNSIYNFRMKIR